MIQNTVPVRNSFQGQPFKPQVIVITSPGAVVNEADTIHRLFNTGLRCLHVRKPDMTASQLHAYCNRTIPPHARMNVMLHGPAQVAQDLGMKGVHYTERTRPPPPLTRPGGQLSVSTAFHDLTQLQQPWGLALDYAFLSPIYDSISKQGYGAAAFERNQLQATLANCPTPIVALGGITAGRLNDLRICGFAGAAVIGSVWQAADPVEAYEQLQQAWDATAVTSHHEVLHSGPQ
mmetsp:Transcript_11192/g.33565  ORF Transcript_11192/g.33565 Transcript_11192/m.33565 type:complete len:233 (+) Transcript_11192:154-852(+)|eukprot:CAMPEP_0206140236 /NCGR_PEP_ID=MMETSP1473-20131121/8733_1 /ASSEMBLY_ACC=CAM_ASM_001109 /TAXON_ID=1461547 /ORGANISM="Stichococcus sp, Strain RCC1054" /LENGTH=232 /DNA_ID=CAMNT_0053534317 /DNA_START=143 /DNA_END=841 /DNA_ORIENTATION=-